MGRSRKGTLASLEKAQLIELVIQLQDQSREQEAQYKAGNVGRNELIRDQQDRLEEQRKLIQELTCLVKAQKEEIDGLKRRLSHLERDSNTSSKPPSSDMENRGKITSLREKTGRKPGGQAGHMGHHRGQVESPDHVIHCLPKSNCQNCGKPLNQNEMITEERRQVFDIPEIKPVVTEYQKTSIRCSCGIINKGEFPEKIRAHVQIGDRMKSFLVYLNIVQLIPYRRLSHLCLDLLGFKLCKRSIENSLEDARKNSEPLYDKIMAMLKSSAWVGSDETSKKVAGKKWWEWVWQNNVASYYAVENSRGYKVVQSHFGENYKGTLLHDCYSAQNNTKANSGHQLCLVHLMRDLKFLIETYKSKWAKEVLALFKESQRVRPVIWEADFPDTIRWSVINFYENKRDELFIENDKNEDVLRLQKRLIKHKEKILLFMKDPNIPFHNNSSEQAIRMTKVKHKISGGFRSVAGAKRHSILLSVIETAKKQNMNVLTAIQKLFDNQLSFQGS